MQINIKKEVADIAERAQQRLKSKFDEIDSVALHNQQKVLQAFIDNRVSVNHFNPTTGYGYDDIGRDTLEKIYAQVFECEDALVRHNIVNGTHCLAIALFSVLRPGDCLLALTGKPYDTLEEVIGISGEGGMGSLKDFGVSYRQVDLKDGKADFNAMRKALAQTPNVKAAIIQRSKGYDWRESLGVEEIGEIIKLVREVNPNICCIVDNCYGEFVQKHEPTWADADMVVGSLIKNPGGGLAQTGGYIAGKKKYIDLAAYRQTCPGIGKECGATVGQNRFMYQGLFMAPHAVAQSVKASVLCAAVMEELGFEVNPRATDFRSDIIQAVKFNNEEKLVKFIQAIQAASPVDSYALPMPWDMPGYQHQVIMAAGTFVSGASIELSADAPIKPPYVGFVQGGLTYESAKIALLHAASSVLAD